MPQPHLTRLPPERMSAQAAALREASVDLRGDATFFEVAANAPEALAWYVDRFYGEMFYSGRVPARLLELARLRLSMLHGCKFCNQGNRVAAQSAGVTREQIAALEADDIAAFSQEERAVLRLADELALTRHQGRMSRELHASLSRFFSDGQIFELGLILGMLAGVAKFLFAYDLVEKEESCPL